MLNHAYYYHGCLKNIVTLFGAMFSDIYIKRHTADGAEYQEIKVPISYAPKQRALVRIRQNPNLDNKQAQITLPRMAYEITNLAYDAARKINISSVSRNMSRDQPNNSFANQLNSPTPYNVNVNLYVYGKNQEDALQIVEQIFPFFNPDMNVTILTIPKMNVSEDIPIILDSVSYEDDYEGDIETRRAIIWTLSFTLKMNFYGPITSTGIIKKVSINVDHENTNANILKYQAKVNPPDANINDTFTIVEDFLYGN